MIETGKTIKKKRVDNNMSVEDLAEKICVSERSIFKWEAGKCIPSIDRLVGLANAFNCKIDDLIIY